LFRLLILLKTFIAWAVRRDSKVAIANIAHWAMPGCLVPDGIAD
jgi:hypothetical protein